MKRIVRILTMALALLLLAGCAGDTETYTCRNLTMTVPAGMEDVSGQSDFAAYTFTLDGSRLAIFGLQERYDEYDSLADYTLADYAGLVILGNGLECAAAPREGEDYLYFSYTYRNEGAEYKYLTATYRSEEGFWMVQICAPAELYNEAACFKYLDSVEFH